MSQLMSVRLRSLGLAMDHPVTCSDWFGPIALAELEREGLPYRTWTREQLLAHRVETRIQGAPAAAPAGAPAPSRGAN